MISNSQQVLDAATTAISLPQDQRTEFFGNLFRNDLHLREEVFRLVNSHEKNLAGSLSADRTIRVAPIASDVFGDRQIFKIESVDDARTLAHVSAKSAAIDRVDPRSDRAMHLTRQNRASVAIATLASMVMIAASIAGTLLVTNYRANDELTNVTRDLADNAKRLELAETQIREMQQRDSAGARQAALPPAQWR